jgi:hypothetical protein
MKQIYIERGEGKVVLSPSPLTFTIDVEDNFASSKTIEVQEGEKQKTENGIPLYLDADGNETSKSITITGYEEKEVTNTWFNEEGIEESETITVEEPTGYIDNKPIMVANMVRKTITFAENPNEFTAQEILNQKYSLLLDDTPYDFIQAGIFLNENKIDLTDIMANTGYAIMQLLPYGYAKSKVLTLSDTVDRFQLLEFCCDDVDLYVNDIKFDDSKVITLDEPTNEIIIRFQNTTDKYIDVKSYAIAY